MKQLLTIILLLNIVQLYAQSRRIEGKILNPVAPETGIQIIKNDTLSGWLNSPINAGDYLKVSKDTNFVVSADKNGKFHIYASPEDSLSFVSYRYISQTYLVADLLKIDSIQINLVKQQCLPFVRCEEKEPRANYAFIGEKINVKQLDEYYCEQVSSWDGKYSAKYKVLLNIDGQLIKDTVEFVAYDHYGTPAFSYYNTVMIYLSDFCGNFYQQKYRFAEVYKTREGNWAAPYLPGDYKTADGQEEIRAEPLNFLKPVMYDISRLKKEDLDKQYPAPYFEISGTFAIAKYGISPKEIYDKRDRRNYQAGIGAAARIRQTIH